MPLQVMLTATTSPDWNTCKEGSREEEEEIGGLSHPEQMRNHRKGSRVQGSSFLLLDLESSFINDNQVGFGSTKPSDTLDVTTPEYILYPKE